MIKVNTYKVKCNYCGGSSLVDVEHRLIGIYPEYMEVDGSEELVRCVYCGREIEDRTLVDTRYYSTIEDIINEHNYNKRPS